MNVFVMDRKSREGALGAIGESQPRAWRWMVFAGTGLTVLGLFGLGVAASTAVVTMLVFGWLMLFAGILHLAEALFTRGTEHFALDLMAAVGYGVTGMLLIRSPELSALILAFFLGPIFVILGCVRVFSAAARRTVPWGWRALSGLVTAALGVWIWRSGPATGLWVLGAFISFELVFEGIAVASIGWTLRALHRAAKAAGETTRGPVTAAKAS